MRIDQENFIAEFEERGCVIVEDVLDAEMVSRCRNGIELAIEQESNYHGTTDYPDFGTVQCCVMYDPIFIDLLDMRDLMTPFNWVLGDGCILYAYLSSSLPPRGTNFANRIHVDCPRLIPNYITNMGVVVPLDDFAIENGATHFLAGSHTRLDAPTKPEFFQMAERLTAPAGSAWFFNARLWHSAGTNKTETWRHSVTMNLCRPYMKQRFDLPRLLAEVDLDGASENARQKLGFYSQPPTSLDEYYAPPEKRTFRQPYE